MSAYSSFSNGFDTGFGNKNEVVNTQSIMLREPNLLVPGEKPVGNVALQQGNPFDIFLALQGKGAIRSLGRVARQPKELTANQSWSDGYPLLSYNGSGGLDITGEYIYDTFSLGFRARFGDAGTVIRLFTNPSSNDPYNRLQIYRTSVTSPAYGVRTVMRGGSDVNLKNIDTPAAIGTEWFTYMISVSNKTFSVYIDGVSIGSDTIDSARSPNDTRYGLGGYEGENVPFNGDLEYFWYSKQPLGHMAKALFKDPYQFLIPA